MRVMLNILFLLCVSTHLSASTTYYEKPKVSPTHTYTKNHITYDKKTNKPFTGTIITKSDFGDKKITIYKDGKKNGVEKFYEANGNLAIVTPYKNGKIEGIKKKYFSSGALYYDIPYKNGKREGRSQMYSESGDVIVSRIYKNGKKVYQFPDDYKIEE